MIFARRAWRWLLDTIFPRRCAACGVEGFDLCGECSLDFQWRLLKMDFGEVWVAMNYKGPVKELVRRFKYKFSREIEEVWSEVLEDFVNLELWSRDQLVIVPIPLHKKRLKWRGFNQAEILAEKMASLGLVSDCLERVRDTGVQASLGRNERLKNLKGAFRVLGDVRGKNVLLVDDVMTTGSTMRECFKVLRNAGAKSVCGLVLAAVRCPHENCD